MKYSILFAIIAGVLGLSACEKTTVTPVPVPQSAPPATTPVPGPQGAPGPQGPAGEPGKSSTTIVTPPVDHYDGVEVDGHREEVTRLEALRSVRQRRPVSGPALPRTHYSKAVGRSTLLRFLPGASPVS